MYAVLWTEHGRTPSFVEVNGRVVFTPLAAKQAAELHREAHPNGTFKVLHLVEVA